MLGRKPPGVSWKIRVLIPYEGYAMRTSDFAPLVKINGKWRILEDHEQEYYW